MEKEILILKKSEGVVREISPSYKVINFITGDISKNFSLAISKAENHNETTKNINSDRAYLVLDGELAIKTDNDEMVAQIGDVVYIPKNTRYSFSGSFKSVLINSPAFNPKDERIEN